MREKKPKDVLECEVVNDHAEAKLSLLIDLAKGFSAYENCKRDIYIAMVQYIPNLCSIWYCKMHNCTC
jgi:hypothetical protein